MLSYFNLEKVMNNHGSLLFLVSFIQKSTWFRNELCNHNISLFSLKKGRGKRGYKYR